jgi:hypothetical protein
LSAAAIAPRSARALVAGPGAGRALRAGAAAGAGTAAGGIVDLAFGGGGYVRMGEHHVLLAPPRSPLGPLSLLVAGLSRGDLIVGDPAGVSGGALVVGALRIDLEWVREPSPPLAHDLARGWWSAVAAGLEVVPPPPADLAAGLEALAIGDLTGAVARLAGRGEGLTPAGDDVLAGYAAWRWAQNVPVALSAEACAPLGREYLRCAERGELPEPAARVLEAIRAGDPQAAARRARGLAEWGASSGAALLWGIAAGACGSVRSRRRPPIALRDSSKGPHRRGRTRQSPATRVR